MWNNLLGLPSAMDYCSHFKRDQGVSETEPCLDKLLLNIRVRQCKKNPGHVEFHPVGTFGPGHLPAHCRDQRIVHYLRLFSRLTVRLTVSHTSPDRQGAFVLPGQGLTEEARAERSRRFATGFAWLPNEPKSMECPIPDCPYTAQHGAGHHVYGFIRVLTSKHVTYNAYEAAACQVEFCDDEVRGSAYSAPSRKVAVQCVGLEHSQEDNDAAHLRCVTHDPWLCEVLKQEIAQLRDRYNTIPADVWQDAKDLCVTVSHPHGMRKTITVGRHVRVVETTSGAHAHYHTCATCPGSSGAPVLYMCPGKKGVHTMWVPAIHSYYSLDSKLNCAFK